MARHGARQGTAAQHTSGRRRATVAAAVLAAGALGVGGVTAGSAAAAPPVTPDHAVTASSITAAAVRTASAAAGLTARSYLLQQEIPVGNGVDLGGFSDLFPADSSGHLFWTVTDRGPNYDTDAGTGFAVPDFTPRIVQVRLTGTEVRVTKQIPLQLPAGYADPVTGSSYVTGLSNETGDPANIDPLGAVLPFDPYGVDTEGVVRAHDGTFWLSEEYRPSVLHVAADGTLLERLVPADDTTYASPGVPVRRVLPAALSSEKPNRGLEALAVSGDGRTLYAGMQSPLAIPTEKTSKTSRDLRVLRIDVTRPAAPRVSGEFVLVRDADSADDGDWKNSAMTWVAPDRLVVEERDAQFPTVHTLLYLVDLRRATNIAGGRLDDPATRPSLEQLTPGQFPAERLVAGAKRLVFDVAAAGLATGKIEGIAVQRVGNRVQLTLVDDNDFGITGVDARGHTVPSGTPTRVDTVTAPFSLAAALLD